jgi:hypothetical protein
MDVEGHDAKLKERLKRQLERSLQPKRPLSAFLFFSSDVRSSCSCKRLESALCSLGFVLLLQLL